MKTRICVCLFFYPGDAPGVTDAVGSNFSSGAQILVSIAINSKWPFNMSSVVFLKTNFKNDLMKSIFLTNVLDSAPIGHIYTLQVVNLHPWGHFPESLCECVCGKKVIFYKY